MRRRAKQDTVDVKLAKGGIRDIEFLVQCLQRLHGGREPWVRHGGTLLALSRLRDKELLSSWEYSRLATAYQFLRHLEHRLQFDEDRQTHTLPAKSRTTGSAGAQNAPRSARLSRRRHPRTRTRPPSLQRAGSLRPRHPFASPDLRQPALTPLPPDAGSAGVRLRRSRCAAARRFPFRQSQPLLDLRAPSLSQLLSNGGIRRSQESMESFLDKVRGAFRVAAHARHKRRTGALHHRRFRAQPVFCRSAGAPSRSAARSGAGLQRRARGEPGFVAPRERTVLRRFFPEQMVRIQSDSVYHRVPVFRTLKRTSDLAESVIAAAYEIAVAEALRSRAASRPRLCSVQPDDGDRARPPRHARIRSRFRCRSQLRHPRRRRREKLFSGPALPSA